MKENRRLWLDLLAAKEGGVSDRPLAVDPGGLTNRGITRDTLAEWRKRPVSDNEILELTKDDAEAIASAMYWNPVRADDLPGGVDLMTADFAFNSGPKQAVKTLQRTLGFADADVDGYIGPLTLGQARQWVPAELINAYRDARVAFLSELKNYRANRKGWLARCDEMCKLALSVAPAKAPAVVARAAKKQTNIIATVTATASAAVATAPIIVAALPAAKETYEQTVVAMGPVGGLVSWLPMAVAAVAAAAVIVLAIKNHRLQQEAAA